MEWRRLIWVWALAGLLLTADLYPPGRNPLIKTSATAVLEKERTGEKEKAAAGAGEVRQADASEKSVEQKEIKEIALTFDDGPHPVYTPKLLDGLKERGVRVSFFLIGESIDGNEDIIRRMKKEGHLIGNHSQSHMQLTKENVAQACSQIEWTNEKIRQITGETPGYLRPPFGSWSEELECVVPMTVALWDVDPLDWKVQNTGKIVRHVKKYVENGSIILLHDVYDTSVEAAFQIIDSLSEEGYRFVTVDELLID